MLLTTVPLHTLYVLQICAKDIVFLDEAADVGPISAVPMMICTRFLDPPKDSSSKFGIGIDCPDVNLTLGSANASETERAAWKLTSRERAVLGFQDVTDLAEWQIGWA
jgi:hypothetical protein